MPLPQGPLWRNTAFLTFWGGETISLLGSQISALALPLAAVVTLHATPLDMGLLSAAETCPLLVLSLPAGVWIDRLPRRAILFWTNAGRALLLATIPLAALLGRLGLPQLYVVALLTGSLSVFFGIAYQAYVPALVTREHVAEANARLEVSDSLAQVAGPATGGALVTLFTAPLAIVFDALSFVAAAISLALIRLAEPPRADVAARRSIRHDLAEGLRFVIHHPILRVLAGITGLSNLFGGMLFAQQILFMQRTLGLSPAIIGALLAVAGPAALLGALLTGRLVARLGIGRTMLLGTTVFTAGDFFLALAGGPPLLATAMLAMSQALIGAGSPINNVPLVSLRQTLTPDHLLGRVVAGTRIVALGTLPLGALAGGLLGARFGLRPMLLVAALGMLLPYLWLLLSPILTIREQPAVPEPRPSRAGA